MGTMRVADVPAFYEPGDSEQMLSAGGHVRPAGTFSFGTGVQSFIMLTEAFLIYGLTNSKTYSKRVLWPAMLATAVAIPLSGSRTLLFMSALMAAFTVAWSFTNAAASIRLVRILVVLIPVGVVALEVPVVQDAVSAFTERFRTASSTEGGLQDVMELRILDVFGDGIRAAGRVEWLGQGIGMGSNVASVLKT
jgi:hypothetical protein